MSACMFIQSKPMLWLEKTYALVGENPWFGRSKPMVWLKKTYGLVGENLWFCRGKPMVCSMTDDTFF